MYNRVMTETTTMQVGEFRANLRDALDAVMIGNRITITRAGKPAAVLLPPELAARALAALDDASKTDE